MRWRFSYKEWKERKYEWHRWFALWPVEVDLVSHTWCWLSYVERQRVKFDGRYWWDYRDIEPVSRVRHRTADRDWGAALAKADWSGPKPRQPRQQILLPHEPIFSIFDPP